jgi:hypothetical protein
MIISRGRKYVFVHIPKTGGTALTLALEARAMRDDILVGDTPKARARRARIKGDPASAHLRKHSPLSDLSGVLTPDQMDSFFHLYPCAQPVGSNGQLLPLAARTRV